MFRVPFFVFPILEFDKWNKEQGTGNREQGTGNKERVKL